MTNFHVSAIFAADCEQLTWQQEVACKSSLGKACETCTLYRRTFKLSVLYSLKTIAVRSWSRTLWYAVVLQHNFIQLSNKFMVAYFRWARKIYIAKYMARIRSNCWKSENSNFRNVSNWNVSAIFQKFNMFWIQNFWQFFVPTNQWKIFLRTLTMHGMSAIKPSY